MHDPSSHILQLLRHITRLGASDLHLASGLPPMMRLHGRIMPLSDRPIPPDSLALMISSLLTDHQRHSLEHNLELDFALELPDAGRFRANAHFCTGTLQAAFRHIPASPLSLEQLGHRPSIRRLLSLHSGLVLVTGITGSGKTSTLAAIIQELARTRQALIITIEDPIEYRFTSSSSIIKQRQVGTDTLSFASALRSALRQDPDIILVGEMRDPETIAAALTAAETGHLVLSTLHTQDAPRTIDRIVDAFPAPQQPQILAQLANCLQAILAQRLIPRADGNGRVLATELLLANFAVRATIREHRWHQLPGLIEIGAQEGMNTLDQSVASLLAAGLITPEDALANCRDPAQIQILASQPGIPSPTNHSH